MEVVAVYVLDQSFLREPVAICFATYTVLYHPYSNERFQRQQYFSSRGGHDDVSGRRLTPTNATNTHITVADSRLEAASYGGVRTFR